MKMTSFIRSIIIVTAMMFSAANLTGCNEDSTTSTQLAQPAAGVIPDVDFGKLPTSANQRRAIAGQRRVELLAFRAFTPKNANDWVPMTELIFTSSVSHLDQVYSRIYYWDETVGADVRDALYNSSYWVNFEGNGFTLEFLDRAWAPMDGHVYKVYGEVATNVVNNTSVSVDLTAVQFQQHGKTPGDVVHGDEIYISTPANIALPRVQGDGVRFVTNAVTGANYGFNLEIHCPGAPNVYACVFESAEGGIGGVNLDYSYIEDPVSNYTNGGYYSVNPNNFGFTPSATVVSPGEVRTVTFHIIPATSGDLWFDVTDLVFRVNNISVSPELINDSGRGCSTILWPLFDCGMG